MILLLCTKCSEGITLTAKRKKSCPCGEAFGYIDKQDQVHLSKHTIPIGLGNSSIMRGIESRPLRGLGVTVDALVMPRESFIIDNGASDGPNKNISTSDDGKGNEPRGILPRVSGSE